MIAIRGVFSAVLLAAVSPIGHGTAHAADAVITWNANAGTAAMKACMNADAGNDPFHESRMYETKHVCRKDGIPRGSLSL